MTKQHNLIGYTLSFTSFLLDSTIGDKISRVILFGSVARGDFTQESDIDLFVEANPQFEKEINKQLKLFSQSRINDTWNLKGIKNEISLKIGKLNEWALKREVISSGMLLFGKFQEIPEKTKYYLLIKINIIGLNQNRQMQIWRKLYGYKQKVGRKIYHSQGLIGKQEGKKIGKTLFIIPMEKRKVILDFLNQNKIKYTVNEIWSDNI